MIFCVSLPNSYMHSFCKVKFCCCTFKTFWVHISCVSGMFCNAGMWAATTVKKSPRT